MNTGILSAVISGGALFISLLVYLRQRSLENENYFFQFKIQQYSNAITAASEILELMHQAFVELIDELEQSSPEDDEIDAIIDEIEEKMSQFRIVLHKSCAFIPKEIVDHLDTLYEKIFEAQNILDDEDLKVKNLDRGLTELDKLEDNLEIIINLMRKDLGIEAIDLRLKKRTK